MILEHLNSNNLNSNRFESSNKVNVGNNINILETFYSEKHYKNERGPNNTTRRRQLSDDELMRVSPTDRMVYPRVRDKRYHRRKYNKTMSIHRSKETIGINNERQLQNDNFNNLENIYNSNTDLINAVENNNNTDVIIKKQTKEALFNKNKLSNINDDIHTIKRQVEISENETLKKNNFIFQLKIIFAFLLISIIPTYLMKTNSLNEKQGIAVLSVFGIILIFILFKNFLNHRFSSVSDNNIQIWEKPNIQNIDENIDKPELNKKANVPINKLKDILTVQRDYAVNNHNYTLAAYYNNMLKNVVSKMSEPNGIFSGDLTEWGGGEGRDDNDITSFITQLTRDHELKKIEFEKNMEKDKILLNIQNQRATIELKLKQKQQSNKVGVDLENNIRELILKEESMKKQLAAINTKQYLDRNDSKDDNEKQYSLPIGIRNLIGK